MTQIFDLICDIPGCGVKTGEVALPSSFEGDPSTLTNADLGISGVRCDAHPPEPPAAEDPEESGAS